MASAFISSCIASSRVTVFSWTSCPYCLRVKRLFKDNNIPFSAIELDTRADGEEIRQELGRMTGARSVPRVFIDGKFIGGCDDTFALHKNGGLANLLGLQIT